MIRNLAVPALALCLFATPAASQQGAAETCETPPQPVVDITSNRFYSDKNHSIVDPVLWEKRKAAMKPLEDYRNTLGRFAGRAIEGKTIWAKCLGTWLAHWAKGGALLGRMNEIQAKFERKWALAGFAMAYLVTKSEIPADQARVIEPWLDRVAVEVARDYPGRKKNYNNHYYWLGFALGASAMATGHKGHWALAEETFRTALTHIDGKGHLPREMARGLMALHYHNFSLVPLAMLAELAAQRGENWYALENGAILRLATFTIASYRDPKPAEGFAGVAQKPIERSMLGWLPFMQTRFPQQIRADDIVRDQNNRPFWNTMAGGNMTMLARKWVK
jgi:poly(beta-D-mannuronate) lyase